MGHIVAPSTHGANSAAPKSNCSLLVRSPDATRSISSKMRWPHCCTRLVAVEDRAAVDVHVVFHALIHRRVGRQLDRRRRLAAEHAAAPGGEAHQVRAARHLAGRRHRVVARRVHEHEALRGHRLRRSSPHRPGWCCPPSPSRRATSPGSWSARRPCCRATDWRSSRRPRAPCSPPTSASAPTSFSPTSRDTARRVSRCSAP